MKPHHSSRFKDSVTLRSRFVHVWSAFLYVTAFAVLSAAGQGSNTLLHSIPTPPGGGPQSETGFGFSVAEDSGMTVVGAPFDDAGGSSSGVVNVFHSATGSLFCLIPNPSPAASDQFGYAVSISGTRVVVGAPFDDSSATNAGMAYVYDLSSANPTAPIAVLNNPNPDAGDGFGYAVGISGGMVVVGARYSDAGATSSGAVYVYDLNGTSPTAPIEVLNNPSPAAGDEFGGSIAISGTRVVVGAPMDDTGSADAGSAYVYDLGGVNPATPIVTINNAGGPASAYFASSVAISGTRVVIGAYLDDTGGMDSGSAYVYDVSGANPTTPIAVLSDPYPVENNFFGSAVGISGMRVVVGAFFDNTGAFDAGSAYVYDLGGADPTTPVSVLRNPSPAVSDRFGFAVGISPTRVVVGAYLDDKGATNSGSAYVYTLGEVEPFDPIVLYNLSPATSGSFGNAIGISGTRVIVGAYSDDHGAENAGSAFVYDLSGVNPTEPIAVLRNPTPDQFDYFGYAVAISGTRVVVGAVYDDAGILDGAGSAYVYDLNSVNPDVPIAVLRHPSPGNSQEFGHAVAISGTRVVIGIPNADVGGFRAGSAYVYDLSSANPTVPIAAINNPSPANLDAFGCAVGISGTRVVVGELYGDGGASDAGNAYVYDLNGANPTTPIAVINNPSPNTNDQFGYSVSISGAKAVIGAKLDDTGAANAGSAYVYDLESANPTTPIAVLVNPSPASDDQFGYSLAISGMQVVVGVYGDDTGASNAGSCYIYDLSSANPTTPVDVLLNPSPTSSDRFGYSTAIDGGNIAVGVPFRDNVSINDGFAYIFGSLPINQPPTFIQNTFTKLGGAGGSGYSGSIAMDANDPNASDTLTYSKVSGPAWLTIAPDGSLSGTPQNSDAGMNTFVVQVADIGGLTANATMHIFIVSLAVPELHMLRGSSDLTFTWPTTHVGWTLEYSPNLLPGSWIEVIGSEEHSSAVLPIIPNALQGFYRLHAP